MDEKLVSSENQQINREQVIEEFRKYLERGFKHPDDLSLTDPEIIESHRILDVWTKLMEIKAQKKGTLEADLEFALERSTVFVDAGFLHSDYLDEVANDWLAQDLQRAEDAGLTKIAKKIQSKIDEINARL